MPSGSGPGQAARVVHLTVEPNLSVYVSALVTRDIYNAASPSVLCRSAGSSIGCLSFSISGNTALRSLESLKAPSLPEILSEHAGEA